MFGFSICFRPQRDKPSVPKTNGGISLPSEDHIEARDDYICWQKIGCSHWWRPADTPQMGRDLQSPLRFQSMGQLGVVWCVWVHDVCALRSRLGMGCSCVLSLPLACLFLGTTPLLVVLFWQCPGVSDELCPSLFSSIWKGSQDGVLEGWDR